VQDFQQSGQKRYHALSKSSEPQFHQFQGTLGRTQNVSKGIREALAEAGVEGQQALPSKLDDREDGGLIRSKACTDTWVSLRASRNAFARNSSRNANARYSLS